MHIIFYSHGKNTLKLQTLEVRHIFVNELHELIILHSSTSFHSTLLSVFSNRGRTYTIMLVVL